jgi:hypothetical protein
MDFGVVYFAYSVDASHAERYNYNSFESAKTVRFHEPDLPITLITSHPNLIPPNSTSVFTSIKKIPKLRLWPGRQWLTRVQSLTLSPYKYTLTLDSDAFVIHHHLK